MSHEGFFDGREMLVAHNVFRREFGLVPGVVRGVADGDRERAGAVAHHVGTITGFLHFHHALEDTYVWPLLLERGSDEIAPTVELMESHHAQLDTLCDAVTTALDAWRADAAAASRDALADALDGLVPLLFEHMRTEENRMVPVMEKCITVEEWHHALSTDVARLSPEDAILIVGMGLYEADREVTDMTVEHMPAELKPVIEELAEKAFAKHSLRIHGTATPPHSTEL